MTNAAIRAGDAAMSGRAPRAALAQVHVSPMATERFAEVLDDEAYANLVAMVTRAQEVLRGRVVWNVNSTARGGGVAEMLHSLVAYARGGGVDTRWMVIRGDPEFFSVTKRIHNHLHGAPGDGKDLDHQARAAYESTLLNCAAQLVSLVRPEDIVLLHDPQTAGMIPVLHHAGARVVWRCHIGADRPSHLARQAHGFLLDYLGEADGYVFSHADHVWPELDPDRVTIIAPSIDAFSPKNEQLTAEQVLGVLQAAGLLADARGRDSTFTRADGSPGRVDRRAEMVEQSPIGVGDRVVAQVSRFDRLKDPVGVLRGFAEHRRVRADVHLVLAGPAMQAVSDDPEALEVWQDLHSAWSALDAGAQRQIHLAALPMRDIDENAVIVNALQRHAEIVVQKSLAEGFGLTVAEAMWKGRPVIASRVGGIQDQAVDGVSGVLLDDPTDLDEFGAALDALLADPARARRIGVAAQRRIQANYLGPRHLSQYLDLLQSLIADVGHLARV